MAVLRYAQIRMVATSVLVILAIDLAVIISDAMVSP